MKRLMLMRHAKSSWANEGEPDITRPLNERGKRDARRIGAELAARKAVPELIVCSTATRAESTVELLKAGLEGKAAHIECTHTAALYGAPAGRIIATASMVPESVKRLLMVGHNPGMQDAVAALTGVWLPAGMKTAAVACILLGKEPWQALVEGQGELEWVLYPSDLDEEV